MNKRRVFDHDQHAHFLTFSCYRRTRLLDDDKTRMAVLDVLATLLSRRNGRCFGYVLMPDHVHAIVWLPGEDQLIDFLKQWKRLASIKIKRILRTRPHADAGRMNLAGPVWQAGYYDFNLYTDHMISHKLDYMHGNPVRAGLVDRPTDWRWSSARHYECGRCLDAPLGSLS
jgi:putative transposase